MRARSALNSRDPANPRRSSSPTEHDYYFSAKEAARLERNGTDLGMLAVDEALKAVQEEFRSRPKVPGWSHPFYWAAWQLTAKGPS